MVLVCKQGYHIESGSSLHQKRHLLISVGTKITLSKWMDGELNDQHKSTSPKLWRARELNGQHKNSMQDGWVDRELNGWQKNNTK